jgi:hypothetical protein
MSRKKLPWLALRMNFGCEEEHDQATHSYLAESLITSWVSFPNLQPQDYRDCYNFSIPMQRRAKRSRRSKALMTIARASSSPMQRSDHMTRVRLEPMRRPWHLFDLFKRNNASTGPFALVLADRVHAVNMSHFPFQDSRLHTLVVCKTR